MNLGNPSRVQIGLLVVLAVIAAIMIPRFFSSAAPVTGAASNSAAISTEAKKPVRDTDRRGKWPQASKITAAASLDPSLRFDVLKLSEDQEYKGSNRNPFDPNSRLAEIPKPVDPGMKPGPVTPPAPIIQPPPPIPLKFYGFATQAGQSKKIFLASTTGDDIFVGTEGQVINRRYRIVKINANNVEIEDILNNNKQTIPLTSQS
jgi:hypothetical protein